MSKKSIVLFFVILLALTLSACTRAASTAPETQATPQVNFPAAVPTSGMGVIEQAGTQTAAAAGMPLPTAAGTADPNQTATTAPAAGTPVVLQPTNTPDPNAVSTALPSVTPVAAAANTAVPQATAQTSPLSRPGTYALHAGEFPYCIARRYNINPDELLTLNGLNPNQSYYAPGTVLSLPQTGNPFPGARALKAHPAQYVVQAGDTIYSVACDFGDVDPQAIAGANNLGGTVNLTAGTTLQVP
jgi:LysM repeat protein